MRSGAGHAAGGAGGAAVLLGAAALPGRRGRGRGGQVGACGRIARRRQHTSVRSAQQRGLLHACINAYWRCWGWRCRAVILCIQGKSRDDMPQMRNEMWSACFLACPECSHFAVPEYIANMQNAETLQGSSASLYSTCTGKTDTTEHAQTYEVNEKRNAFRDGYRVFWQCQFNAATSRSTHS